MSAMRKVTVLAAGMGLALAMSAPATAGGPPGTQVLGYDLSSVTDQHLSAGIQYDVALSGTDIPSNGKITEFSMYVAPKSAGQQVQFEVWRLPQEPGGLQLIYRSKTVTLPADTTGVVSFPLRPAVKVQAGDYYGLEVVSSEAYFYLYAPGETEWSYTPGNETSIGSVVAFNSLTDNTVDAQATFVPSNR